jgi:CBS-domain-containing membrane protein
MKISDCMKRNVVSATANLSVREAIQLMMQKHIGTLPITDEALCLVGLVRTRDIIALSIPNFFQLVADLDFVRDFGVLENEKPNADLLERSIKQIMTLPIYVEGSAGLIRAITLLQDHKMIDLPVVDEEMHLVGIASYVDISLAIMSNWLTPAVE